MKPNSYLQLCMYFCICLIVFTLAVNFVNAWNIYTTVPTSYTPSSDASAQNVFAAITGLTDGMEYIWLSLTTLSGLTAIGIALITRNTSLIGIWVFSSVLWTSYSKFVSTININSWIPSDFLIIFTVAILFIWIGAIINMLAPGG